MARHSQHSGSSIFLQSRLRFLCFGSLFPTSLYLISLISRKYIYNVSMCCQTLYSFSLSNKLFPFQVKIRAWGFLTPLNNCRELKDIFVLRIARFTRIIATMSIIDFPCLQYHNAILVHTIVGCKCLRTQGTGEVIIQSLHSNDDKTSAIYQLLTLIWSSPEIRSGSDVVV